MKFIPAYVLHTRPYRETSLLVEFFTFNQGKMCIIARSARGIRSRFKGCLLPFAPLVISYRGKSELLQLVAVDIDGPACFLQGHALFNGIYLNELLMKLLQRHDPYPDLFLFYREILVKLQSSDEYHQQVILRTFEKRFLAELGYGLQLNKEQSGKIVRPQLFYRYNFAQGFIACEFSADKLVFRGDHLLAIEENYYDEAETLRAAKKLMRLAINALLEGQLLKSRELYR